MLTAAIASSSGATEGGRDSSGIEVAQRINSCNASDGSTAFSHETFGVNVHAALVSWSKIPS